MHLNAPASFFSALPYYMLHSLFDSPLLPFASYQWANFRLFRFSVAFFKEIEEKIK